MLNSASGLLQESLKENHDEDWINVGHNNVASYTNMDPGEYTLKVMATNGDGVWKEE